MLFLLLRDHQTTAAEILWAHGFFPLGCCIRSRFLPRFSGVWLVINGVTYVCAQLNGLLVPQYQDKVFYFRPTSILAEIAFHAYGLSSREPNYRNPLICHPERCSQCKTATKSKDLPYAKIGAESYVELFAE